MSGKLISTKHNFLLNYFFKAKYRIKWEGYSHHHNTWEPRGNLTNCNEVLENFELTWGKAITALKLVEDDIGLNFQLIFKCGEYREITAMDAISKWPKLTISYFEKCFKNVKRSSAVNNSNGMIQESNPDGEPFEVICKFKYF